MYTYNKIRGPTTRRIHTHTRTYISIRLKKLHFEATDNFLKVRFSKLLKKKLFPNILRTESF